MADATILAAGSEALPAGYTVPAQQVIQPKMVRAVVDGTGASGSFVAVCQIVSDSGIVIAEGVCSTTVAAGGSAQVSWFPGGGLGSASAAITGLVEIDNVSSTAVGAGAGAFMALSYITGTHLLDLTTPTSPAFVADGYYVVAASMAAFSNATTQNEFEIDLITNPPNAANAHMIQTVSSPVLTRHADGTVTVAVAASAGDVFQVKITNRDTVSRNFISNNIIVVKAA